MLILNSRIYKKNPKNKESMVHISNGSVSFPKVPLSTQVFVFRKTQRNGTGKKSPQKYYGAYCMICYDMEINNFYKEIVNNIMYKYLL